MKKILILRSKPTNEGKILIKEIKKRKKIDVESCLFSELKFVLEKDKLMIFTKDKAIEDFSLIYIVTAGLNLEKFTFLTSFIKDRKIPIIDHSFIYGNYLQVYKFFQMFSLVKAGLPYPRTFIGEDLNAAKNFFNLKENFQLIAKSSSMDRGEGVFLINNDNQLKSYLRQGFLIQEYLEEELDLRILVIDGKIIGGVRRIPKKGEFRANLSLGGTMIPFKLTPDLEKIALKAAKAMGFDFSGVDILVDKNHKIYVLEVNHSPQYFGFMQATGINVTGLLADFLEKKLA